MPVSAEREDVGRSSKSVWLESPLSNDCAGHQGETNDQWTFLPASSSLEEGIAIWASSMADSFCFFVFCFSFLKQHFSEQSINTLVASTKILTLYF